MGTDYDKGAQKYSEYPMQSVAEQYYQLRKSIGIHNVNGQIDIDAEEYRSSRFVILVDTEKVLGASFSGYNSTAGDSIVLRLAPVNTASLTGAGNVKLHYVLHYDSIMNIRDGGVELLG